MTSMALYSYCCCFGEHFIKYTTFLCAEGHFTLRRVKLASSKTIYSVSVSFDVVCTCLIMFVHMFGYHGVPTQCQCSVSLWFFPCDERREWFGALGIHTQHSVGSQLELRNSSFPTFPNQKVEFIQMGYSQWIIYHYDGYPKTMDMGENGGYLATKNGCGREKDPPERLMVDLKIKWYLGVALWLSWLVVWNMAFIFHFICGMSSFPLTFIFFRGVYRSTTNQLGNLHILRR